MEQKSKSTMTDEARIPIIIDVERNIDGHSMIRCSYFSIQSDGPMPNWTISREGTSTPMLLLNLGAILIGSPKSPSYFRNVSDIELMYDFVEDQEELFVDINEIWVPLEWFGNGKIKQGLLFRMSQEKFSMCWKLRNDIISTKEFYDYVYKDSGITIKQTRGPGQDQEILFSKEESEVFNQWTMNQIEQSREIYQSNRENYLQKIQE